MALETVNYVDDLVSTNPIGATDPKSEGDDHLRNIKKALKAAISDDGTTLTLKRAVIKDVGGNKIDKLPAGTRVLFQQTAAPTGWTKDTTATYNEAALRIVTGAAGTGGSVNFTTAFASGLTSGAYTLTTTDMPSHTHTATTGGASADHSHTYSFTTSGISADHYHSFTTDAGGSHAHDIPMNIYGSYDATVGSGDSRGANSQTGSTGSAGSHTHTGSTGYVSSDHTHSGSGTTSGRSADHTHSLTTAAAGGGGSHSHTIPSFAVKYADAIIASKDA